MWGFCFSFQGFYDFISNVTGVKHENLSDVWVIHDTLLCEVGKINYKKKITAES